MCTVLVDMLKRLLFCVDYYITILVGFKIGVNVKRFVDMFPNTCRGI